jgi:hypothetical protein
MSRLRPAFAALGVVLAGCGLYTPQAIQQDYARSLAPARLQTAAEPRPQESIRHFKVRVYADREYRRQTVEWEKRVAGLLEHGSEVLQAQFGVVLEPSEFRPWEHSGTGANLKEALDSLVALDKGEGADLVLGMVTALPIFSASQDQLGMANVPGNHLVLRGIENPEEYQHLAHALNLLSDDEREALYKKRRQHKEVVVLLHEWAHALGTLHDRSSEYVMCSTYLPSQAPTPNASSASGSSSTRFAP